MTFRALLKIIQDNDLLLTEDSFKTNDKETKRILKSISRESDLILKEILSIDSHGNVKIRIVLFLKEFRRYIEQIYTYAEEYGFLEEEGVKTREVMKIEKVAYFYELIKFIVFIEKYRNS